MLRKASRYLHGRSFLTYIFSFIKETLSKDFCDFFLKKKFLYLAEVKLSRNLSIFVALERKFLCLDPNYNCELNYLKGFFALETS